MSIVKIVYQAVMPKKIRVYIYLKKYMLKLYLRDKQEYKIKRFWSRRKKHYGKLNADKTFYVLRKYPEATGLLSCYLTYLGQLRMIDEKNYLPIVDMKSHYYKMSHNSQLDVGKVNAWELYFEQLTNYRLEDVYNSKNVILGHGYNEDHLRELFNNEVITDESWNKWSYIDAKYMRLNSTLKQQFEKEYHSLIGDKRTIGVMVREGYAKLNQLAPDQVRNHAIQPDLKDMIADIKKRKEEWNCDYVFISTESMQTIESMKESFVDSLIYTERNRRGMTEDNYQEYLRKALTYAGSMTVEQRNLDYLKEVYLLSKCTCLITGKASGSVVANIWNAGRYEHRYFYLLGMY